jgi:hypothetical protein
MRISPLITGILLVIGAVADHVATGYEVKQTETLINNLQQNVLSQLPNMPNSESGSTDLTNTNSLTSISPELEKIQGLMELGSIVTGIGGVGLIVYGVLAKAKKKQSSNSQAFDILKTRLAKGEIEDEEFDKLKKKIE